VGARGLARRGADGLAEELGLELDAEAIILSDVRDLLTLRGQLRRQLTRGAWPVRRPRVKGDGLRITTMGRPGRRVTGVPPG